MWKLRETMKFWNFMLTLQCGIFQFAHIAATLFVGILFHMEVNVTRTQVKMSRDEGSIEKTVLHQT